jgi:hypothetical protein
MRWHRHGWTAFGGVAALAIGGAMLVNRYAIGSDWWDHPNITLKPAYLGLDYFPADNPAFAEERAAGLSQTRTQSQQVDDWGRAEILCTVSIEPDKSIRVSCSTRVAQVQSDPWHMNFDEIVPPKTDNSQPGYTIIIDRERSEMAWPVRAHYELIIHNDRAE